jgi:hypothetical protein
LPGVDIYWVNNRNNREENVNAKFRVQGKEAEIWYPETGKIEKASFDISNGITNVPLHLVSNDAIFIVFRKKTSVTSRVVPQTTEKLITAVEGPWDLTFQPNRGAPSSIMVDTLSSWSVNSDPGVKYFSGTGTYSKNIEVPENWLNQGDQIWLDLGKVKNLAEVWINGKSLGIIWKTPFRVEVTDALKTGSNRLEIKVTNLWVNRLIGDQQPGIKTTYTYTTRAFYAAESPLLPSGLLGPVRILSVSLK